jgi:hypothetical protein
MKSTKSCASKEARKRRRKRKVERIKSILFETNVDDYMYNHVGSERELMTWSKNVGSEETSSAKERTRDELERRWMK